MAKLMSVARPPLMWHTQAAGRSSLTQCRWRFPAPCRIWAVQRVEVPGGSLPVQHVGAVPVANELLLVPEVPDARIGHTVAIPAVAAVAEQHVEPHRVDPQVWIGILAQDVLLDPTGPLAALGSSRRDQHDEPRLACILVECVLQIPNGV